MKRIRRGRNFLTRRKGSICVGVLKLPRSNTNVQPAGIAVKSIGVIKVQTHCKVAVDYIEVVYINRASHLSTEDDVGVVEELEL
ncbi:hypothetical protein ES703_101289 [subsurface metagenome]